MTNIIKNLTVVIKLSIKQLDRTLERKRYELEQSEVKAKGQEDTPIGRRAIQARKVIRGQAKSEITGRERTK